MTTCRELVGTDQLQAREKSHRDPLKLREKQLRASSDVGELFQLLEDCELELTENDSVLRKVRQLYLSKEEEVHKIRVSSPYGKWNGSPPLGNSKTLSKRSAASTANSKKKPIQSNSSLSQVAGGAKSLIVAKVDLPDVGTSVQQLAESFKLRKSTAIVAPETGGCGACSASCCCRRHSKQEKKPKRRKRVAVVGMRRRKIKALFVVYFQFIKLFLLDEYETQPRSKSTAKNALNARLYPHYERVAYRKMRWYRYINSQRSDANMVNDFGAKLGTKEQVVLAYGDWLPPHEAPGSDEASGHATAVREGGVPRSACRRVLDVAHDATRATGGAKSSKWVPQPRPLDAQDET
ncbi:hypothetical protein BASA81_011006 [Batrachochytrium salamandrivorans]|nr:hypothetical protein BASA81_011006 [Batrachochytrium salamandrivorans]